MSSDNKIQKETEPHFMPRQEPIPDHYLTEEEKAKRAEINKAIEKKKEVIENDQIVQK